MKISKNCKCLEKKYYINMPNYKNIQNLMMLQVFLKCFHRKPTYFSITPSSNRLLLSFLGGRVQLSADIVIWHQFFSKFNFFFLSSSGEMKKSQEPGPKIRKNTVTQTKKKFKKSKPKTWSQKLVKNDQL